VCADYQKNKIKEKFPRTNQRKVEFLSLAFAVFCLAPFKTLRFLVCPFRAGPTQKHSINKKHGSLYIYDKNV
jgi:hypothetical protein